MMKELQYNTYPGCCFLSWPTKKYKKVVWEITSKCNLRCGHCIAGTDKSYAPSELPKEDLLNIAQLLSENSVSKVLLTGGEPLLRPEIYDIICFLNENNIATKLATNGTLLSEKNIKKLKSIGQDSIIVSLDGATPQVHDAFRGVKGSFGKTIRAIKSAVRSGISVTATYTASRQNIHELSNVIDLCETEHTKHLLVNAIQPIGRARNQFDKYALSLYDFLDIDRHACDSSFEINPIRCNTQTKTPLSTCPAGTNIIGISSDGFVNPCPWLKDADDNFYYGNIFNYPDLSTFSKEDKITYVKEICNFIEHNKIKINKFRSNTTFNNQYKKEINIIGESLEILLAQSMDKSKISLVHNDLHPNNILVTQNNSIRVIDRIGNIYGEQASDVATISLFYIWYELRADLPNKPFLQLYNSFMGNYLNKTGNFEILKVLPTFYAVRALRLAYFNEAVNQDAWTNKPLLNFFCRCVSEEEITLAQVKDCLEER